MKCANCGSEIETGWKVCPQCGTRLGQAQSSEVEIKDCVVKEISQSQTSETKRGEGAVVGGGIYITLGERKQDAVGSPELEYEEHVLSILRSGGNLEKVRPMLEEKRRYLRLSLARAKEIESACLEETVPAPTEDAISREKVASSRPASTLETPQESVAETSPKRPSDRLSYDRVYNFLVIEESDLVPQLSDFEARDLAKELASTMTPDQFDGFKMIYRWIERSEDGPRLSALKLASDWDLTRHKTLLYTAHSQSELEKGEKALDKEFRLWVDEWKKEFSKKKVVELARQVASALAGNQLELFKHMYKWIAESEDGPLYSWIEAIDLATELASTLTSAEFDRFKQMYLQAVKEHKKDVDSAVMYARKACKSME